MNSKTQARIAELVAELNKCIEEYEENYQVDDKVLVSNDEVNWHNRYFAEFDHCGDIMTWPGGSTSWSATHQIPLIRWEYYKKFL